MRIQLLLLKTLKLSFFVAKKGILNVNKFYKQIIFYFFMNKTIDKRPWGNFEQFCLNEKVTVKIINVNPNSQLSLQYHFNREEFWKILKGKGKVFLSDKWLDAKEGDEFFIEKKIKHRIKAEDELLQFLEISFGIFDEKDEVRLEDDYNRK